MRGKIIAVFAVIVLMVGGLAYALARASLREIASPGEAPRALAAAMAQLQVDGLVLERWLASHASDPKLREPFNAGTAPARAEAATSAANAIREAVAASPELARTPPSLVVLVDTKGVVLGRNASALMRGDNLGAVYPSLMRAIEQGVTGSDVWVSRARNEQLLASYAPIRSDAGQIVGAVAVGTALNDERLTNASERTSGRLLVVAMQSGDGLDVVAKSRDVPPQLVSALTASPAKDSALRALSSGRMVDIGGLSGEYSAVSHALDGYGDGRRAVLLSIAPLRTPGLASSLLWPMLGVTALGLVLVVIAAYFLDAYISQPVSEIEDGLLAIMNGRTDLRFGIEHAELGGLVFRLNSLLNQLLGVQEDETDAEGRPSRAPTSASFRDALEVDERMAALSPGEIPADAKALLEEPEDAYYARIFAEYIAAKRSLGDPVDHITRDAFVARLKASEQELGRKHGKPMRYKVEVRGKEIVLLAVPLA
ncbi:MXAN_5187 C-terminal domain-containing protein [Sorangium sp. So ce1335]|uniref:MXAN_5187 C-terminal domain-containing protein n=1 Tax=Sorangium sp. So ce1335 TaxID=3133335 RepID=UPI003F5FD2FC